MLILIIFGVLLLLGIGMLIVSVKCETMIFNKKGRCVLDTDNLFLPGIIFINVFGFAFLISSIIVSIVQIRKDLDFKNAQYEKQVLEYRLEHLEDNFVGGEMLYSEIIDFNNDLRSCKKYSGNVWIGLFYNDKVATLDYILIGGEI